MRFVVARGFLHLYCALLRKSASQVVEEQIQEEMTEAEIMTVLVDESTDKTNKKRLSILVKTVDEKMDRKTHFLANVALHVC